MTRNMSVSGFTSYISRTSSLVKTLSIETQTRKKLNSSKNNPRKMFSYKLLLVCLMLVHCILSMPTGDDVQEQQGADMDIAEHKYRYYGGYGGYHRPYYYAPYYYGAYGYGRHYGAYWG